jgi:hypothetical protein
MCWRDINVLSVVFEMGWKKHEQWEIQVGYIDEQLLVEATKDPFLLNTPQPSRQRRKRSSARRSQIYQDLRHIRGSMRDSEE